MEQSNRQGLLKRMGKSLLWRIVLGLTGAVLFILFWEFGLEPLGRWIYGNPLLNFPTFSESVSALIASFVSTGGSWNQFYMGEHLMFSLGRVMAGFAIAVFLAVPLALIMGYVQAFEHFAFPINELARPIPPIAWIPVAVLLLSGEMKVIFICFLGAYFPILINTLHGVKSIDPVLFDAAKVLGANRVSVFFKVVIPASTGYMLTGLRIGLGISWMTIVAAEMIGASNGVGWYIQVTAMSYGRYDLAIGAMMLIGLVGYAIFVAMEFIERRALKWIGML